MLSHICHPVTRYPRGRTILILQVRRSRSRRRLKLQSMQNDAMIQSSTPLRSLSEDCDLSARNPSRPIEFSPARSPAILQDTTRCHHPRRHLVHCPGFSSSSACLLSEITLFTDIGVSFLLAFSGEGAGFLSITERMRFFYLLIHNFW